MLISFCSLSPKELPVEEQQLELPPVGFTILPGWKEMGNYQLKRIEYDQSIVSLNFLIDINTSQLSSALLLSYLKTTAEILDSARVKYARSSDIDEAINKNFITNIMPNAKPPTQTETGLITKALTYPKLPFVRIPGSLRKDSSVEMFHILSSNESAYGKAVGIVDTSAEECLSWAYHICSFERMAENVISNGNLLRAAKPIPDSRSIVFSAGIKMPTGVNNRVFHSWFAWDRVKNYNGNEALILAFAPTEQYDQTLLPSTPSFPNQSETIIGKSYGIFIFESLAPRVTRMAFIQQVNMGGSIPVFLLNSLIPYASSIVQQMVDRFKRRGKEVDFEIRVSFISKINTVPALTDDQQRLVERCKTLEDVKHGEFAEIESSSHRIKYYQKHDTSDATRDIAIGKAITEIDESAQTVLA